MAERSEVTLAYTTSCGFETAPRIVEAVHAAIADLLVATGLVDGATLGADVRAGTIDVGLARHLDYSDLERHVVRREREGVLMLADDPLV